MSGRVEPAELEKRLHLPEMQSRQVLAVEISSFARMRQVRPSRFANGRNRFRAYASVVAQVVCDDLLDGCRQGRDFGATSFQDDWRSWPTAYRMLRNLRQSMGDRDRGYWFEGLVEMDDAFVGGRKPGKRGRGAEGKKPVIFAVELREEGMGFMAARVVKRMNSDQVRDFARRISPNSEIRTDALHALRVLNETHCHQAKVTPPEKVNEWLPKVHIVISNFKRFLNGTFHGVSHRYLQEYIDEFVFRFNRRFWEPQLPDRLLQAAVDHVPIRAYLN